MASLIFPFLMLSALGFVLVYGKIEERLAVSVLIFNFVGTAVLYWIGGSNWLEPQIGIFLLDTIGLLFFAAIAFRSKRFWPLPVAAFQMIPVMTFFVTWVGLDLSSQGI